MSEDEKSYLFEEFKTQFSKSYQHEDEETQRKVNFIMFLTQIDVHNAMSQASGIVDNSVHGITIFSDMTHEDFVANYAGMLLSLLFD